MDESSQITDSSSILDASQVLVNIQNSARGRKRYREDNCSFKKNDWLDKYFKLSRNSEKVLAYCRTCNQDFANRSHNRLIRHLVSCEGSNFDQTVMAEDVDSSHSNITKLFIRAMVAANWSFKGMESKEVKAFFSKLSDKWVAPRRQDISAIHIPRMSNLCMRDFKNELKKNCYMSLSVMFDHWEDANHRSFLGIIATHGRGDRTVLDLRDVSLLGHYSSVIVDELKGVLGQLPLRAINSIVSDSASTCKKARQDIIKQTGFKHIIQHRCMAHLMNLVGTRVSNSNVTIKNTIKQATKATGLIANSTYWVNYIKSIKELRPHSACPVRWYSTITMIEGLVKLRNVIVHEIMPKVDVDKALILGDLNWENLQALLDILRPLCGCIAQVEGNETSLGESVKYILEYAKQLFSDESRNTRDGSAPTLPNMVMIEARKAFLHHFNENKLGRDEFGLLIAAYAMDRRFKMDYMTEEAYELCYESIAWIAVNTGITIEQVEKSLMFDLSYYRKFEGNYGMTADGPIDWWMGRAHCGVLSGIGLRLAYLKASSADIERTFSTLKFIQGDYRLNLSRETLLHLARLKISLKNENKFSDHLDLEDYEEGDATEIVNNSFSSESDQLDESTSSITLHEAPNWIEDQSISVKRDFQSFFTYFDFSRVNESQCNSQQSVTSVTLEQVRERVRETLHPRSETVIVDTHSQMIELDNALPTGEN